MNHSIKFILVCLVLTCLFFSVSVFAQDKPLPPPVDISFNFEGIPQIGKEVGIKVKVTPKEEMHAEITCFLPAGLEAITDKKDINLRHVRDEEPYGQRYIKDNREKVRGNKDKKQIKPTALCLWLGPIKANETKEYIFQVKIPDSQRYEIVCRAQAMAKWGFKDESFVIDLNGE